MTGVARLATTTGAGRGGGCWFDMDVALKLPGSVKPAGLGPQTKPPLLPGITQTAANMSSKKAVHPAKATKTMRRGLIL